MLLLYNLSNYSIKRQHDEYISSRTNNIHLKKKFPTIPPPFFSQIVSFQSELVSGV